MDAMDAPPNLIQKISFATGLPPYLVQRELVKLVSDHGLNPNDLTLDLLRDILANYLQDILLAAKTQFE